VGANFAFAGICTLKRALSLQLLLLCFGAARVKRSATNSDDQLSDSPLTSTPRPKKRRVFFTDQQKNALRDAFQKDSYPNQTTFEQLASELGVGTKTVVNWFHNHRMRAKQQQVVRRTDVKIVGEKRYNQWRFHAGASGGGHWPPNHG